MLINLWHGIRRVGLYNAWLTAWYRLRLAYTNHRFPSPQENLMTAPLGDIQTHFQDPTGVTLVCSHGLCHISAISEHIWRLRITPQATLPPYFSYATILDSTAALSLEEENEEITLSTGAVTLTFRRAPFAFRFSTGKGRNLGGWVHDIAWEQGTGRVLQDISADMRFYGMGERAFPLNLRGRRLTLTTCDPQIYRPGDDPLYMNIPFLLSVTEGETYGLLFDSMADGTLDLDSKERNILNYRTDNNEIRLDFIAGPKPTDVLNRYAALTGQMVLPPLWTLGYHQSRWSYETAQEVRELAHTFRQRRIPCEAIHFDIDYMDGFRCFTWDRTAFPDPKGLLSELHDLGFKAVGMIDPGIKADPDYWVCAEGLAQDMFCKLPDDSLFHGPVWPGECYFPDFTNPRVRDWWGTLYRGLLEDGFDSFWNDMNEPTIFGSATFPDAVQHDFEGHHARHQHIHSAYGMQMIRATYEGLNQLRPQQRNWVFSRSGYAGLQRYGSSWTADNTSEWDHLRLTPAMLLNLGLSGISFTGADIGGFEGSPSPALFARWISMGAFTPFFRTHTAKHTPPQEPWSFGPETEAIARTYIEWRYRLLPYLYTTFWQCSHSGVPIMRPLWFEDPTATTLADVDDQWLLGDNLLVAPVLTPHSQERDIILPAGDWYDFWNDRIYRGEDTITRAAPLDVVPLFVRAGTVIPLAAVRQSTAQTLPEPPVLHFYLGEGESWLYEDDGISMDYQEGSYRLSHFRSEQIGAGRWRITRKVEGHFTPLQEMEQLQIHGIAAAQIWVDNDPVRNSEQTVFLPRQGWESIEIQAISKI